MPIDYVVFITRNPAFKLFQNMMTLAIISILPLFTRNMFNLVNSVIHYGFNVR